jgi:hypothetical protein
MSLGLFLIAIAAIIHSDWLTWHWIFVVMFGMSFVNALAKKRWRWVPQPLMWCLGLSYAYSSPPEGQPGHVGGWTMFFALCGASLVLSFLTNLIPKRAPKERPAPPPRPGAGIVIDVSAERSGDDR